VRTTYETHGPGYRCCVSLSDDAAGAEALPRLRLLTQYRQRPGCLAKGFCAHRGHAGRPHASQGLFSTYAMAYRLRETSPTARCCKRAQRIFVETLRQEVLAGASEKGGTNTQCLTSWHVKGEHGMACAWNPKRELCLGGVSAAKD
jgi:hypothetical protein